MIKSVRESLEKLLLIKQVDTLPRWQRMLRLIVEVGPLLLKKLREDQIPMAAAALTYHSIFGLVPSILLGLIAYRTVGNLPALQQDIISRIHDGLQLQGPDADSVRDQIDSAIGHLFEKAQALDVRAMGAAGVLLLVFAAISLVVTVEKNFNIIYRAPRGRPWALRIAIYWAVVTLGPLLAWASIYLSRRFLAIGNQINGLGWLFHLIGSLSSFAVMYLLILLLYRTLPAVRVHLRAAMLGALVATLGIQALRFGLQFFFVNLVMNPTRGALYGSLAVLPVCLLWTCLLWGVLLAGLQVSWVLQHMPMLRSEASRQRTRHQHELAAAEAGMVIPCMVRIGRAFRQGHSLSEAELCAELHTTGAVMRSLMDKMVAAGFLHDVLGADGSMADGYRDWGLAKPPEAIALSDLLAMAPVPDPTSPGATALAAARAGQIQAVTGRTLADLLDEPAVT